MSSGDLREVNDVANFHAPAADYKSLLSGSGYSTISLPPSVLQKIDCSVQSHTDETIYMCSASARKAALAFMDQS